LGKRPLRLLKKDVEKLSLQIGEIGKVLEEDLISCAFNKSCSSSRKIGEG
jgi:hypothetical protein